MSVLVAAATQLSHWPLAVAAVTEAVQSGFPRQRHFVRLGSLALKRQVKPSSLLPLYYTKGKGNTCRYVKNGAIPLKIGLTVATPRNF